MRVVRGYLNEKSVLEIFAGRPVRSAMTGTVPASTVHCRSLALRYNISNKTIRDIWNRNSWARLTGPFHLEQQARAIAALAAISEPTAANNAPAEDRASTSDHESEYGALTDLSSEIDTDPLSLSAIDAEVFDVASEIDAERFHFSPVIDVEMSPELSLNFDGGSPSCWLPVDPLSSVHLEDQIHANWLTELTRTDLQTSVSAVATKERSAEPRRLGSGAMDSDVWAEVREEDRICTETRNELEFAVSCSCLRAGRGSQLGRLKWISGESAYRPTKAYRNINSMQRAGLRTGGSRKSKCTAQSESSSLAPATNRPDIAVTCI
eukprot:2858788-Rhodomonas_salina.3